MSRKYSEGAVREALADMDLDLYVFKPQDMPGPSQNTKPADFLLWWPSSTQVAGEMDGDPARSGWLEVKETPAVDVLNLPSLFTASQVAAMRRARELNLPYLVAIHWTHHKRWTITVGWRVLVRIDGDGFPDDVRGKYKRADMPINCAPGQLAEHLRQAILGEID